MSKLPDDSSHDDDSSPYDEDELTDAELELLYYLSDDEVSGQTQSADEIERDIATAGGIDNWLTLLAVANDEDPAQDGEEIDHEIPESMVVTTEPSASSSFASIVDLVKKYLARKCEGEIEPQLLPVANELKWQIALSLGYATVHDKGALLKIYECVANAHQELLHEVAMLAVEKDASQRSQSTVLPSERTTIAMATDNPEIVLRRKERLRILDGLNPTQSNVFRLWEFGGCEPAELASAFADQFPADSWTPDRVRLELNIARAFVMA